MPLKGARNPGGSKWAGSTDHLISMLAAGISFHGAFIVFGAQRLWAYELAGPLAIAPWVLPTVVGIPAISAWIRYYRRKFGPAVPSTA